ncbi:hypothetical protein Tco_0413356 [Tanacetum coccineum]
MYERSTSGEGLIKPLHLSQVKVPQATANWLKQERRNAQGMETSHASGSGADEGTGVSPRVLDVPKYGSEDEHISWKFSNEDDDDEKDPDEKDKTKEGSDLKVQTPSHYESTDDEESDEVAQGGNVEGEELDEEETNKDKEVNELYKDVNVNLEGRDTEMTDALQTNVQVQQQSSSVSSGFISNMLNPNPDTGIDSILNLNTESTSLVDVPITTNADMPLSFVTTLPPPPIPFFQPLQQTPVSTTTIVLSTSL